jgi:flagellar assembly protein FliH
MLETTHCPEPKFVRPLEYRAILAAGIAADEQPCEGPSQDPTPQAEEMEARVRELERELAERSRRFAVELETARAEAHEAGRCSERGEQAERIARMSQALDAALAEFAAGRDRYLAQVEREVVKLALAIAARVLHREAEMDPLLLAGAVKVALGQLSDATEARLKVPAEEESLWSELLRATPDLPVTPAIVADPSLCAGECFLETQLGSVDLGVRGQLAEIERGFFDLLEQREKQSTGISELTSQKRDPSASSGRAVGRPNPHGVEPGR